MHQSKFAATALLSFLALSASPAHAALLNPNDFTSLGTLSLTDTSGSYMFDTGSSG